MVGFVTKYAVIGGTRHLDDLKDTEIEQVLLWSYIVQFWATFNFIPAKTSVGLLIVRLMRPLKGWRFWMIVGMLTLLAVLNILDSILVFAQCNPPAALWDKSITNASCLHSTVQPNFSIFVSSKL